MDKDEFAELFSMESNTIPSKVKEAETPVKSGVFSPIQITDQFQEFIDTAEKTNQCIFLTGDAGTGKSTLINHWAKSTKKQVVKLAPTGVAAVNIGGQTIHSFFRFPPKPLTADAIPRVNNEFALRLYRNVETIIIDEISMVRADLLDGIDIFLRMNLASNLPFGGKQIIMIGDLNQLPPVIATEAEREMIRHIYDSPYFFSSTVLTNMTYKKVILTKVFRQKDPMFINILNKIKSNSLSQEEIDDLNKKCVGPLFDDATTICTINQKVDILNYDALQRLTGNPHTLIGNISGTFNDKNCPVDKTISVKIGCKLMLLNNHPEGFWVNGTTCTLLDVCPDYLLVEINGAQHQVRKVDYENIRYEYSYQERKITATTLGVFTQYPVRLAYASTIHKAQGKTLSKVNIEFGERSFAHGMTYVALSRATSLEGIRFVRPMTLNDIIFDKKVGEYLNADTSQVKKTEGEDDLPF